jgi:hypothetical protein
MTAGESIEIPYMLQRPDPKSVAAYIRDKDIIPVSALNWVSG